MIPDLKNTEQKAITTVDLSNGSSYKDIENQIFKSLYDTTKQELDKKQEAEILNYRLGKIEFEIKNTVPLLEYSKEKDVLEDQNIELKIKVDLKKRIS